jgi:hypothetical protein
MHRKKEKIITHTVLEGSIILCLKNMIASLLETQNTISSTIPTILNFTRLFGLQMGIIFPLPYLLQTKNKNKCINNNDNSSNINNLQK